MLGLAAFLVIAMTTMGTGILVFLSGLYLIAALNFSVVRFVHVYLMAMLGIGFMFCLGYILVPLLIFDIKELSGYFKKWVNLILGYMLTPIIMFGFMGMMMVGTDLMIFSGQYSVWKQMAGPNAGPNAPMQALTATKNTVQNLFYISHNPSLVKSDSSVNTGAFGTLPDYNKAGSKFENEEGKQGGVSPVGFEKKVLDLQQLSQQTGKSESRYISDLLISCLAAAIFIYIMYSLLSYIPDLAGELASQGTSAGRIVKTEAFAQAAVLNAIQKAKDAVQLGTGVPKG